MAIDDTRQRRTRDVSPVNETKDKITASGARYGLVIGIDRYPDKELVLKYAGADADAMYNLMVDPCCGLFEPKNVVLLKNEQATGRAILDALHELGRRAELGSVFWLYFAGHAVIYDGQVYWIAHDTEVEKVSVNGISDEAIARQLKPFRARQIITFLDCCHASAMRLLPAEKGMRAAPVAETDAEIARRIFSSMKQGEGEVRIAACGRDELALEDSTSGHGLFTSVLVDGLRGAADRDWSGVVTVPELLDYLDKEVPARLKTKGHAQAPQHSGRHDISIPLTVNPEWVRHIESKQRLERAIQRATGEEFPERQFSAEEARALRALLSVPPPRRVASQRHVVETLETWSKCKAPRIRELLIREIRDLLQRVPLREASPPSGTPIDLPPIPSDYKISDAGTNESDVVIPPNPPPLPLAPAPPPKPTPEPPPEPPVWHRVIEQFERCTPGKIAIVGDRAHGKSWYLWALNQLHAAHRSSGWRFEQRERKYSDLVSAMDGAIRKRAAVPPTDLHHAPEEFELFRAVRLDRSYSVRICDPAGEHLHFAFSMTLEQVGQYARDNCLPEERQQFLRGVEQYMLNICTSEALLLLVDVGALLRTDLS